MLPMSYPFRFIGIIPARYASSRFPGKPLADVTGKIMVQRVYEQASKVLDTVFVATDDERILKAVGQFGGLAVMTSPDHKNGTERCAEAIQIIEEEVASSYDVVINIQGDEPFIHPDQLNLIKSCFDEESVQIATLVKKIEKPDELFDPNKPKVVLNKKNEAIYFSRSPVPFIRGKEQSDWVHAHIYYLHIGMYGYRKKALLEIVKLEESSLELAESLEQLRWIENGYRIHVRTTPYASFGIDTPEDLNRIGNTDHFF